jgi:hypothetical protein
MIRLQSYIRPVYWGDTYLPRAQMEIRALSPYQTCGLEGL